MITGACFCKAVTYQVLAESMMQGLCYCADCQTVGKQGQLHSASFGSTPGKMAASAALQKILSVDQLKLEKRAGGIFDCDATGCYDRIIPPLATVHLKALGLDPSIATLLARLMFTAKRFVKTKHGVSTGSIRTTEE